MSVIKKLDTINGVRFWRQNYPHRVPTFEVFRVVGHDLDKGIYYFQSITSSRAIMGRGYHQLGANGFEPFLYVNNSIGVSANAAV